MGVSIENRIKIFQGSGIVVEKPQILISGFYKDFGYGFYCTNIEKQAKRLILNTLEPNEDYIQGLIRVYNAKICEIIDNYNSSAYYEPLPTIVRSYYNSSF